MSSFFRDRFAGGLLLLVAAACLACVAWAEVGERFERLTVAGKDYWDVEVKSANASSLIVLHRGGLAQLPLSQVPSFVQERYGYSAEADRRRQESLEESARSRTTVATATLGTRGQERSAPQRDSFVARFGSKPELLMEVDLRPRFRELDLAVKYQGRRPSCAVFAVVGALEYLHASATGRPERLSEEYLIWATLKSSGLLARKDERADADRGPDADMGFSLSEVASALRGYGIPLHSQLPNRRVGRLGEIEQPTDEIIADARGRSRIRAFAVPGRSNRERIQNLVHSLNAESPVAVGLPWPHYNALRNTATLSRQKPRAGAGHAVTLVGYRCPSGKLEDATFLFRNAWGPEWGAGGYGFIRYEYLLEHGFEALALEVDAPPRETEWRAGRR